MCLKWFCFISIATSTVNVNAIWILPRLCWFQGECCPEPWIPGNSNVSGLSKSLQDKIYGQHIVLQAVKNHIIAHMTDKDPPKALSLSLHGGAGTGKTTTSSIIAQSIYKKGIKSKFVHYLFSTTFFTHNEDIAQYQVNKMLPGLRDYKDNYRKAFFPFSKKQLKETIETSVKNCERSMFIFDEIDTMPPGLVDVLIPYLDYHDNRNGINYRKAIFIFISNTGGKEIFHETIKFFHEGNDRDTIELKDMEMLIEIAAVNSKTSGFHRSDVLLRHLITAHVPFLPLERNHVRQCIKDYLLYKKYYTSKGDIDEEKVREIANQLEYFPEEEHIFAALGCKRVSDKTAFLMAGG